MTGRDLIIYILSNHLEDEEIFKDGTFVGFVTLGKAAELLGVGLETVRVSIALGLITGAIEICDEYLIPEESIKKVSKRKE